MKCCITQRQKNPMQSGKSRIGNWVLTIDDEANTGFVDSATGWISSRNMMKQVVISFDSLDAAKNYANHHQMPYTVRFLNEARPACRSYADNFK